MSTIDLKKNMMIKNKYMNKKFGYFKSAVYRKIQYAYFKKKVNYLLLVNEKSRGKAKIESCKEIYNYFYSTRDIWTVCGCKNLASVIRNKLFEFSLIVGEMKEYLVIFGYVCPYFKMDGKRCYKKTNKGFCDLHHNCKVRFDDRVEKSIQNIPINICNIICAYALNI